MGCAPFGVWHLNKKKNDLLIYSVSTDWDIFKGIVSFIASSDMHVAQVCDQVSNEVAAWQTKASSSMQVW